MFNSSQTFRYLNPINVPLVSLSLIDIVTICGPDSVIIYSQSAESLSNYGTSICRCSSNFSTTGSFLLLLQLIKWLVKRPALRLLMAIFDDIVAAGPGLDIYLQARALLLDFG